jgi:hypothetical protein
LLAVRDAVAGRVLESVGISLPLVRGRVARKVGVGDRDSPEAIPFTPRAKRIVRLAVEETVGLGDKYVAWPSDTRQASVDSLRRTAAAPSA